MGDKLLLQLVCLQSYNTPPNLRGLISGQRSKIGRWFQFTTHMKAHIGNGHVTDDVTWPLGGTGRDPKSLRLNISVTEPDRVMVSINGV
jgi:hypothetical protein